MSPSIPPISVGPIGKVQLLDVMGTDTTIIHQTKFFYGAAYGVEELLAKRMDVPFECCRLAYWLRIPAGYRHLFDMYSFMECCGEYEQEGWWVPTSMETEQQAELVTSYKFATRAYATLKKKGVPPRIASLALPHGGFRNFYANWSLNELFRFCGDFYAQPDPEFSPYVEALVQIARWAFPQTIEKFCDIPEPKVYTGTSVSTDGL